MNRKTIASALASATLLGTTLIAGADPQTFTTSFEFTDTNGFIIGSAPQTAVFSGGAAKPVANAAFARSGSNAWHLMDEDEATITFTTGADSLTFWMRSTSGTTESFVQVFDESGIEIVGKTTTTAYEAFSIARTGSESKIGKVTISTVGPGAALIDDLEYTANDTPTPSTITAVLEEPVSGQVHSGVGNLRGWAFAPGGIERVDLYVDGEFLFSAPYGGSREDVEELYPEEEGAGESGFSLAYGYSNLLPGEHTIVARVYSNSGDQLDVSSTFDVVAFDKPFINAGDIVDLGITSFTPTADDTFEMTNVDLGGRLYDLTLRWRTAEQGFEIIDIR